MSRVAAVDIGGTKINVAAVDIDGHLGARRTEPTPGNEGPAAVLRTVETLVRTLMTSGDILAVGVGSGGVVDPESGVIRSSTAALSGWAGTDLRGQVERALRVPVAVVNDVHAHAIGEYWKGQAQGSTSAFVVAVGTGVGASLLLDGRAHHGAHAAAGHFGHLPVSVAADRPCPCGGRGHLEAVASGPAMVREYRRRVAGSTRDLQGVVRAAEQGDAAADGVLREGAGALGAALGGMVNILDPQAVVVGGGVAECGQRWWEALQAAFRAELLPAVAETRALPTSLGTNAALVGAGHLAWKASGAQESTVQTR